jgi:hypothetical protein
VGNPLIWLSGAQPELLSRCPTDKPKYVGIGSAILLTAGVASTSMTFALTTALRAPLLVALPFALLWGLAIMSLDRWLVVSLQREAGLMGLARYLLLAGVRLALALLIGFIVSTPFVLEIFHPEIDNEIDAIHAQRASVFAAHPPLESAIANDITEIKKYSALASQGLNFPSVSKNSAVASLERQLNSAKTSEVYWDKDWNCQEYGIAFDGNHCRGGNGPLAKTAYANLQHFKAQVSTLSAEVNKAISSINAHQQQENKTVEDNANASLAKWQAKLIRDQNTQKALTAAFNKTNGINGGLLIRLQALSELTNKNSTLTWARWLLFALFTVIECLPVLVKTLLNLGSPTAYERIHTEQERMWLDVSNDTTAKKEQASRIEADSILAEAQRLADRRQSMIEQVTQQAVTAEQNVAMAWINDWESRQLRDVGRGTVPTGAAPRFRTRPRLRRRLDWNYGAAPPTGDGGARDGDATNVPDSGLGNGYRPGAGDYRDARPAGGYQDWDTV